MSEADDLEIANETRDSLPAADTLASSVVILLVMTVVQRLVGFGRGVLFCRWLDPEQLGQWDVTFGFLMLAAPLAVLGLPGSFGRYLEYYRFRGQLGAFLRRTTLLCTATGVVAVLTMVGARYWFSELIFGRRDHPDLVLWIALCLATVIAHNFLVSLFIALRMYRVVNLLQFLQSLGFALLGVPLLIFWKCDTASVVVAYGVASLVAALGALSWLKGFWPTRRVTDQSIAPRDFWAKLIPFATWVWVTNLVTNLFEVVDRYMIIHCSGMPVDEALRQVGCYHSSRLIPLLFVSIAALLGSMVTPHLSFDWEAGRRAEVSTRLNTVLKTLALALLAASTAVLVLAPYLFNVAFAGKFAAGLAVLPATLAYCAWFGMFAVAQNYLWCAEKAGLSSLALLVGLVVNVALNLVWLPTAGLAGAVAARIVSNLGAIVLVYLFSRWHGMRIELGTWLLTLAPAVLCFGPLAAIAVLAVIGVGAFAGNWLFHAEEKRQFVEVWFSCLGKLKSWRKLLAKPEYAEPIET